MEIKNNI